jgi:protein-disulfide isomerase
MNRPRPFFVDTSGSLSKTFISCQLCAACLFCADSSARCQTSCPNLTVETTRRLEHYLDEIWSLAEAVPLIKSSNHIVSSENVDSSCYKKLLVKSDSALPDRVIYLSPDYRFIMAALSDTFIDPLEATARADASVSAILLGDKSPSEGNPEAAVKVVVFEDYECPFCKRLDSWFASVPSEIRSQIYIVYKNLPLTIHPWASQGAAIATCAFTQNAIAYQKVRSFLFTNQDTLDPKTVFQQVSGNFANDQDVDVIALHECFAGNNTLDKIDRDRTLAASLKVDGTPTIFVNGHRISHMSSENELTRLLTNELLKTKGSPAL